MISTKETVEFEAESIPSKTKTGPCTKGAEDPPKVFHGWHRVQSEGCFMFIEEPMPNPNIKMKTIKMTTNILWSNFIEELLFLWVDFISGMQAGIFVKIQAIFFVIAGNC